MLKLQIDQSYVLAVIALSVGVDVLADLERRLYQRDAQLLLVRAGDLLHG
jgi:hypothetical protein